MTHLNLTQDERALLDAWRMPSHAASHVAFYVAILAPMLLFAGYGLMRRDYVAEFIAFFGVLLILIWRIAQEIPRARLYRSLLGKIAEHESSSGSSAPVQ